MPDATLFDYPDPLGPTDIPLASWPDVLLALVIDRWARESDDTGT
jgi:hypothetical protein